MTTYMKRFVFAALFYLALSAIFGMLNGWIGLGYFGSFAHSHFNLLGFMSMIVFGIGYFILPRFNGTELRFESWVPIHFWLANISLIGMVVFRGLQIEMGVSIYEVLFVICAGLQVISIMMFVINIWITLSPRKKSAVTPESVSDISAQPTKAAITLSADTKVADLVDTLPSTKEILVKGGLASLEMPGHIDRVRMMGVTLGMAAANHGLDLNALIVGLNDEFQRHGYSTANAVQANSAGAVTLSTDVLIGEVIEKYPRTREIFQKHFGSGCFQCPGQAYESIDMACRMHGVDPQQFLSEVNAVLS